MTTRTFILIISSFLFACASSDIDNPEKRNENWCWFVDKGTGEGKWVPITNETNLPDGDYTLFFCNGKIRQTGKLKDKKDCDTIFYYDINEKIISKTITLTDSIPKEFMPNGKYQSYYSTCEILGKGEVKDNKIIGTRLEYYKNGKTKLKTVVENDTTILTINYFESGLTADSSLSINGKLEGLVKGWHSNGNLKASIQYKNGLINGFANLYYENGQINKEGYGIDGKEEGKMTFWYENGQIKKIIFLVNGVMNGQYLSWYENGQKEMELEIKNGNKDGKQIYYYNNGKVEAIREYSNGIKVGQWKEYDANGKFIIYEYANGELIK